MAVEIPLKTGGVVTVDEEDAYLLNWKTHGCWFQNSNGYVIRLYPRPERLHRRILERKLGRPLSRWEHVDHIDSDKLNCRRDNLRLATHAENMRNRGANGERTYKGVYRAQCEKESWIAKITFEGEQMYLGTYRTPEHAAKAYDRVAMQLHGDFAALNFPGEQR